MALAPVPMPTPNWLRPQASTPASGLLGLLGVQSNPFLDLLGQHSSELVGLGAGLAGGGPDLGQAVGQGLTLAQQGKTADFNRSEKAKADALLKSQTNQTIQYLQQNRPDLVQAVQGGGLSLGDAWKMALSPDQAAAPIKVGATDTLLDPNTFKPLYTPDPTNARGVTPAGYRWTTDGNKLEPIPGGPADPNSAQAISPEALHLIATQYLAGDKSAITGYARNANMRAQIANAVAEMATANGMDGKALAAEISAYGGNVAAQRSAGTRAAQVGMAASEANKMADIALTASKAVPRDTLVPWNSMVQAVQKGTSSPEMAQFVTATTSLVNAYARAISPLGAPTDAMRAHAEEMLNTAQGPDAYAAVIAQMKKEMEAALNAPAEISDRLKTSITGVPVQQSPDQPAQSTGDPELDNLLQQYGQ